MTQFKVEIYTSADCSYCDKAKTLLKQSNFEFVEWNLSDNETHLQKLLQLLPGTRTLPQIFINGNSIGSYEDLVAWFESGSYLISRTEAEH